MKPMSEKQFARWEKQRAGGKWLFLAKNTLISSFIWMVCGLFGTYLFNRKITQELVVMQLFIGLILSALLNLRIWSKAETDYQSLLIDKENNNFNQ
jgi:hypothetical protein